MQQIIFQREVLIDAPLAHVWQLVATEEGLRQWWGNRISLEAKEGGRCEEWRPGRTGASHWRGAVTLYAPPHQLMLTLRSQEPHADVPELTTISITLQAAGTQTRVQVSQRAFGPTEAIGTEQIDTEPTRGQGVPLSQLQQPAPGAVPMPAATPLPTTGRIVPAHHLFSQQQSDALTATWQTRLTSLAASAA
jgi:uncharacterized protein YndB with AHSA1/START domain